MSGRISAYEVLAALCVELAKADHERAKYRHAIAMVRELIDGEAPKVCACGRDVSRNKIKTCLDCRRRAKVARWDATLRGRLSRRAMSRATRSEPSEPHTHPDSAVEPSRPAPTEETTP